MLVVKIGGPVYRIGVGGGAASSVQVQGQGSQDRDLSAVQRGDPEMEQKMNRVLRGCIESVGQDVGQDVGQNPICSIHDQGAGGNGNVLKEISDPAGAIIYASRFELGDPSISILELWGAEYQESNAVLVRPQSMGRLKRLAQRERCPISVVGNITGDGKIVLVDDLLTPVPEGGSHEGLPTPVNLDLQWVLGKMPQKEFIVQSPSPLLRPLELPPSLTVLEALGLVLRLPAVGSKRYLTSKVDRSVTGLVAQQQCVGPLHTPLADVAVVALSHLDTVGAATALGEQPIKGLLDPGAGARMALTEALTNLVFARVTDLRDVKCSGNWMWGSKCGPEGGALVRACQALVQLLQGLGVAIDGGKDSLSMAARVGNDTVMAPGTLVISAYAVCPDITATVTPDLKCPEGKGALLWVPLSPGRHRLGGSALAQVFSQLGEDPPDLEDPKNLDGAFRVTQSLIQERALSAGHDVSDGGLITCVLEMGFAGNCGLQLELDTGDPSDSPLSLLFAEEPGLVLEVPMGSVPHICQRYRDRGLSCIPIGHSGPYGPDAELPGPRVAVLREEGSNGDREMAAAFLMAGFQVWDVTTQDLCSGSISLDGFRGLVFVGGFSYGDVLGSAKGWAAAIRFHPRARAALERFRQRPDTFSLGVCNGCQLMALLGWIGPQVDQDHARSPGDPPSVALTPNTSGRFESRFVTVRVEPGPAMMLKGMEGTCMGVWVAHGEGRFQFRSPSALPSALSSGLVPLRYVDDVGDPTERYPMNPNGSGGAVAALCSPCGRHLGLMPHPERGVRVWQWAWWPPLWGRPTAAMGQEAPWTQ
uniref:phosphoribosylformylglycinamidine synthase n=1 Tax=Melopsittacus undulatus TaxID=13146 RepID=A0A8V5GPK9_MELUD